MFRFCFRLSLDDSLQQPRELLEEKKEPWILCDFLRASHKNIKHDRFDPSKNKFTFII